MAMTDDSGSGFHQILEGLADEMTKDLFLRFHRPVLCFFLRRGFSLEESRDLAQETFLRVYRHIEAFRGESSVETWLFQIAANLYKNTLRGQSALKRAVEEVSMDGCGEEALPPEEGGDEGPLEGMLLEERLKLLRAALEELPPQMKKAVFLRVDRDLKYREIADEMDVSIETVKAHLYQAREHLRKKLLDYFTDIEL